MATPREDYIENLKSMGYSQSEAEEKADEDSAYLAIGDSPEADPLPWSDEDEPVDANVDIDADTDVDTDADLISEAAFDAYYDPSPAPGSERSYSYTTDQAKRGALREDVRELAIEEYRSQGYSEQEAEDAADADLLRLSVRGGERLTDEDLERLGRDPELRDIPTRRIIDIDEPDTLELSEVMQRRVDEATSDFRSDKQSRLREQFSEALPDLTLEDIAEAGARALISPIGPGLQTFWGGELEAEQIPIEQEELDERPALQRVAEEFVVPAATALPISLYQAVSPLIDDEESYEERYDLLGEAAAELPQYVEPMPLAHDFLGYQGEVNLPRFIADPINYFDRQYGDIVDAKRRLLLEAMDVDVSPGSEQGQRFQERADLRQLATGIEDLDMLMPQLRESTSREDVDGLIGRLQLRQIPDVLRLEEGRTLDAQALVDAVEQYDIQMPESIVNLRDALEQEADEERIADLLSRVRYGELPPETRETLLSFESLQEGIKKRDDARKRLGQGAEDFAVAAMETAFMTTKRGDDGELYITETTPAKLMRLLSASEAAVTEGLVMPSVDFLGSKVWDGYTPTRDYDRTNFLGRVAASVYNGQLGLDLDLGDAYLGIPGATAQDPGHRWAVTSGLIGSFLFPYEEMAGAPHRAALRAYRGARPVWDLYEGAGTTTRAGRTAQAAVAGAVHPDPVDFIARMVEAGAIEQSKRGVSPLSGLPKDVRADAVDGLRVALGMDEEAVVDLLARTGQANAAVAATHIDNLRRALNNESPAPDSLHANPEYLRVKSSFGAAVEQGSLKPAQANAGMALLEVLAHRAVADGKYESTAQFFNQFELDPRPEVGPLVPEPGTLASGGAAPTFYSAVERAVGGFLGETRKDRLQIDQLLNRLDKEPGVRADEMEFLGLRDWLQEIKRQPERKGFVQGQELRDYIDRNALELEFVRLGDDTSESLAARQAIDTYSLEVHEPADRLRNREHQALGEALGPDGPFVSNTAFRPRTPVRLLRSTGETVTAQPGQLLFEYFDSKPERRAQMGEWVTADELTERLRGRTDDALGEPINIAPFIEAMEALDASQAKLKELYAAADAAQRPSAMYAYDDALQLPGGEAYQEVLVYGKRRGQPDKRLLEGEYLAPHFDNRGDALLFHLRLNNRKGPDGERVLFVEEVQSDLMTEARRKGMRAADGTFDPVGRVIKMAERDKYQLVDEGEQGTFIARQVDGEMREEKGTRKPPMSGTQSGMPKGQYMSWRAFIQGTSKYREAASVEPVPYAPLRPHWHKTALKQVLRDAAVGGYDAISWTTGLQQAERYSVGGRVEHLAWDPDLTSDIDTSFSVEVDEDGHIEVETRIEFPDDDRIELVGQLRNGEALRLGEVNPTNLHEYVDAETTEKLLNKLAVYKTRLTEAVEAEVEDFKSLMNLRKLTPKERLDYAARHESAIPRFRIENKYEVHGYFESIEAAELGAKDFEEDMTVVELTEAERIEILEDLYPTSIRHIGTLKWALDAFGSLQYLRNQREAEQNIQTQFERHSYGEQFLELAVRSLSGDALRLDLPEDAPPQMVKGFESLYDRAIPKWLKRYTKRHGTRPTRVEMDFDGEPGTVNYLKITDSLRESVLSGQPLFQRDKKTRRARGAFQRRLQEPDAKVTAKELLQELKRINLVSSKRVLEVLGDRPETLAPIITFMAEQRDKLLNGEISARDVAKAYLMTTASQGSGAIRVPTLTAKTGFVPDEFFSYEKPKPELGRGIRPEEAVAAWLMSEAGMAALDELEGGTFNRKSWEPLAEIRSAFGDDRINNLGVLGTGSGKTLRDIEAVTAEINAANGDPKKINKAVRELSGIAHVKSPFLMHLLGFGDSVTLDAVEVNFWLTGQGRIGRLTGHKAAMARYLKGRLTSSQLHQELSRRIHQRLMAVRREHGIGLDIPAELFNHIMHQWIWDNAVGRRTTQQGMMKAMAFASPEDALRGTGAVQERLDLGYDHGRLLTPDQRRELVASQSFFVPDDDSYYVEARGKGFALVSRADGQDVGLYSSKAAAVDAGAERSVKEGLLGRPTPHDADSSPVRVGPLVQGQTIHEANRAIQHADVEYLAAWSEGKPLLRKRGAKRSVDPTTEEWNRMRRARGVEGTHNHPGNKIFSVADVITALAVGMRRFSATNVNGRVWTLTLPDRPDLTSSLADARGLFDRDNPRHRTNADLEAIARDLHDMQQDCTHAVFKEIKAQEQARDAELSYDEKWEILNAKRQEGFQAVLDRHVRGSTIQASAPRRHPHGLVASVGRRDPQIRQASAGVGGPVRERSRVPSASRRLGARGPRRTGPDQGAVAQQLSFLSSNPDSRVQVLSVELAKTLDVALPETSIEVPDTEPPIRGPADPFGFSASASRIYELAQSDDPLVLSQLDELLLALPSDVAAEGRLAVQLANAKALIISPRPFVVDVDVDHTVIVDSMRGLGRRLPNVQPLVSFLDHEIRAARRLPLEVGSRAEQATRDSLIYHLKQAQQTVYEEWISRDAAIRSPDDPFALSEIEQQAESLVSLLKHQDQSVSAQGRELLLSLPDTVQRAIWERFYEDTFAGRLREELRELVQEVSEAEDREVTSRYAMLVSEGWWQPDVWDDLNALKNRQQEGSLSGVEAQELSDALSEYMGEVEELIEVLEGQGWEDQGDGYTTMSDAALWMEMYGHASQLDADINGTPTPPLAEVGKTVERLLSEGGMDYHPYFPSSKEYEFAFRSGEPDEDFPERVIRVGPYPGLSKRLAAKGVDVEALDRLTELLNSTDEQLRAQGEELAQQLPDIQQHLNQLSFEVDPVGRWENISITPDWLDLFRYKLVIEHPEWEIDIDSYKLDEDDRIVVTVYPRPNRGPAADPSLIRSPADPFLKEKLVELVTAGHTDQAKALSDALGVPLDLGGADLGGADLRGANLSGADLRDVDLGEADVIDANLSGADLRGASLRGTGLDDADLSGADLSGADLSAADLRSANLRGANLSGVSLAKADLWEAQLDGVYYDAQTQWPSGFTPPESAPEPPARPSTISSPDDPFLKEKLVELIKAGRAAQAVELMRSFEAPLDLSGADLKEAVFSELDLSGANFSDANLDDAGFEEANLRGANFSGANLEAASLEGADLRGANFSGANLYGANLDADLRGADLSGAVDLDYSNLSYPYYDDTTRWPSSFEPPESAAQPPVRKATISDADDPFVRDFASELAERTVADPAQRELYAENFRQWWRQSAVVDADGNPLQVYHGTSRADRIEGPSRFMKERATSGPMAFFTTDPALASSYTSKSDTSLDFDGDHRPYFTVNGKSGRKGWVHAWWGLPRKLRDSIATDGYRIRRDWDNDEDNIILGPKGEGYVSKGDWAWRMKRYRGNALAVLWDIWHDGGEMGNDPGEFLEVLRAAGIEDASHDDPKAPRGGIFPVYLSIQKPLRTDDIPAEVVDALDAASREPSAQPSLEPGFGADQWDKRTMDPKEWVRRLRDDLVDGVNSFVWTRIPDWVTETLQGLGYDGIQDTGGKMGGDPHTVWIPFEEPQVKSVFNQGRWSREDGNIIRSPDDPFMREKLVELIKAGRAAQAVELMRSFEAPLDLSGADFSGDNIGNVDLSGAILSETSFTGVNLRGANLSGADLRSTTMSEVFAPQANVSGADLRKSQLDFQNFRDADLTDADFSWSKIFSSTTEGAVLKGARFFGAVVRSSSFENSDLTGADLTNADFSFDYKGFFVIENSFEGSNLSNAKMFGANLRSVDFTKADLTGADLRNADLRGATFRGATGLDSAQLDGIYYDGEDPNTGRVVAWPDGFEPPPSADAPAHMRGLISDADDPFAKPTDTPAFRQWFGDSKVVDELGEPLVVLHGSPDVRDIFKSGFKSFSRGDVFFAAKRYDVANSYADDRRALDYQAAEPGVIPLYLSIQNPMIIDAQGQHWRNTEQYVEEARAAGHDGIIIENSVDYYNNTAKSKPTTVYAWFKPTQAKSARTNQMRSRITGKPVEGALPNIGTFDPADPSLIRSPDDPFREAQAVARLEQHRTAIEHLRGLHEYLSHEDPAQRAYGHEILHTIAPQLAGSLPVEFGQRVAQLSIANLQRLLSKSRMMRTHAKYGRFDALSYLPEPEVMKGPGALDAAVKGLEAMRYDALTGERVWLFGDVYARFIDLHLPRLQAVRELYQGRHALPIKQEQIASAVELQLQQAGLPEVLDFSTAVVDFYSDGLGDVLLAGPAREDPSLQRRVLAAIGTDFIVRGPYPRVIDGQSSSALSISLRDSDATLITDEGTLNWLADRAARGLIRDADDPFAIDFYGTGTQVALLDVPTREAKGDKPRARRRRRGPSAIVRTRQANLPLPPAKTVRDFAGRLTTPAQLTFPVGSGVGGGFNVLSLFDGISTARQAMHNIGLPVSRYIAAEIDRSAIAVTKDRWPNTEHVGDVQALTPETVGLVDILVGGSPCQDLRPGRKGLKGSKSKLFWEYARLFEEASPRFFLFENTAHISKKDARTVSRVFGVDPIQLDSALVSGQTRKRYFWTNIPGIQQPDQLGVKMPDVILTLSQAQALGYDQIGPPLQASTIAGLQKQVGKTPEVTRFKRYHFPIKEKSRTLKATMGSRGGDTMLQDGTYRRISRVEAERLQGLPDDYTSAASQGQALKGIGNAFTVQVIEHILSHIAIGDIDRGIYRGGLIRSPDDPFHQEKMIELVQAGHIDQAKALADALEIPLDLRDSELDWADLSGADLSGALLSGTNLSSANLRDADLSRADLSGADLTGADLRGADLYRANLSNANLSEADLSTTDLQQANLSGVNFRGVNFTDSAMLDEANLDGIYYDGTTRWPRAFTPPESAPEPPARPSLIRSPDDPFAVPRMVELLSSPDPFVRAQGEELLHSLPSLSRRVEDQLAKELFKTDLLKDLLTGESKPQHMVFQDAATSLAFHLGLLYNGVGPGGIAHRSRPALRGLQRFLPSLLDASERIIKSNRRFIIAERVNGHGPGTAMFAIEQLVKLDGRARQVLAILNGQEPVDALTIGEWWSSQEAEVTYSHQLVNIHFAGKPAQPPVLLAHEFAKAHPANAGDFDFNGATDDNVLVNAGFLPVIHPLGMIRDADDPFAKTKATPKRAFTIEKSGPKNVPPVVREWAVEAWQQSLAGKTAWTAAKVRDLSKRLLVAHKNLKGMRAAELRAEAERIATTSLQRHLKYSRRPGTWSPAEVVYGPNSNEAVNNAMMPAFVAYEQTIQSRGTSPRVVRSAVAKLAKTLGVDLKERLSAQRWTHEEVRLPNGKTKRVPRAFVVLQRDTNSPLDATTYPTRAEAVAAIKTKSPAEKRNLKPVPKPAELSDLSSDDLDLLARDIAYRSLRVAAPGGVPMPMTTAVPGSRQSDALAWWQKSTAKKPPTVRMVRSLLRKLGLKESSPEFQAAKPRSVAGVDLKAMPEAALSKLGSALLKEARKAERALSAPKETTRKNAALSFANVDEVKARTNGQALRDPAVWQQAMAEITGEDHVLDAPVRAMELVGEPTKIAGVHQGLTAGQRRDVIAGMRISDEFAESYAEGSVSPVESALLLLWGSLSKRLSPYPHEAGFLDAVVDGVVPHIEAAIAGNFDLKAFQSWATKTTRSMSQRGSPGVMATGNLNAFGEGLLLKMSAEYKPGVSFLQHFHNLVSDPNLSGTEVRRRFFSEMPEKVGINAKVLSFILLVAGKRDLLVLDRVQIRHLWGGEAKAEQYGTPNPYEAWAPPADPLERDPANWGSWASSSGPGTFMVDARGLAIYELIEDSLSEAIEPLIARGDLPEGYSLGQFHWESWVYESAQEVSHGTLEAILKLASGEQDPFLGASVREGKYDTKASGFEYAVVDQEGTRAFIVELSNGDKVEMNRPALKGYLKLVDSYLGKISRKTGIKFNVSESTTEPWFERPEVDRAELDKFIREQLTDTSKGKQARLRPDSASEAAVQDADADSPRGPRGVISSPDDPFLIDNLVNMLELALVSGDPARISDVESKLAKASENARAAVLERVPHYRPEPAKGVTTGGPADSRYSRDKDNRVRGQFQTADLTNVITLFKNGDFNTFLHESGHLLEELMPADEYQSMVSVFESANGKLTPNGQEQLADAFMWYLRTRKAADGRVWAVLSKVELLMRRLWLAVKRQRTDVLPEAAVEVWDQWLRPDLVLDNEVVEVTAKAGTKLLPTVVLPEKGRIDDSIRGALLKESRENRAKRLPWRRDELLQQTRLKPGDEVTINEALARVLGVVAAERTRRSLGSSGLSDRAPVVMTTRSVVPAARARSIAKQAQARMLEALDLSASEMRALLKATTDNRVTLTNAQQAGLRRLASQVATEPMGRSVDKRLLDDNADLSSVSLEEINSLQEALIDTIAGPASGRSREAESVPSTVGFAVARALGKLPSAYWPKLAELQKSLSDAFVLKQPLEGKVDPMIAELVDARSRELGTVDEWIRRKARELQTSGAASLRAVLEGLREQLTAPVAVESLSHISSLLDLFHGQQRAFLVKELLNETTLNMVDTVLNHGPGKSALERVAVNTLQGYLSVPFEKMSEADQRLVIEAVGVVVDGTRRRAKLVEQRGRDIATCLLGKEKSLSGIKPAQFRELYEAFYKGHWTGADLKLEQQAMTLAKFAANHGVTDYSLEFALVEMIARLRAREVLAGMASDLSRHGLLMDDETIASMAGQELTEVPPQVTDYLDRNRSKSAVDAEGDSLDDRERTEFSRQVKHYLNAILTRPERVLDDQGAVLGAMDIPTPSDAGHALEAYNVATSILARYGISPQSGVKWVSAVMPDGSRALMPANVNAKLKAALNRNTPIGELAKLPGGVLGEVANGLLETLFSTDRNIKMGLTTGNLIPNPAYYTGCFVGMVFQVHQGMGAVGGVRASGSEPRMCVAVTRRLWGHGHRIGEGRAMMTRDGRVYTADMLADLSQRYGLDSSLVQSESAIPLLKDIKRLHATGFQKFASHLRAWQEVLVEAATALDNYFRVAMFIDKLKQGESPDAAAAFARRVGYDYNSLTSFEKKTLRRAVLFYSFIKLNLVFLLDTLLRNPGRFMAQMRLLRGLQREHTEEDPQIVLPDWSNARLIVGSRNAQAQADLYRNSADIAVVDGYVRMLPAIGAPDAYNLLLDLYDAGSSMGTDQEAMHSLLKNLHPVGQALIVGGLGVDPFTGRGVESGKNEMPTWMVEFDQSLFDGELRRTFGAQLTRDKYGRMVYVVDREDKARAWWMLTNLGAFVPGLGRSMDTITQFDRTDLGLLELAARTAATVADEPDPGMLEGPRPGRSRAEEAAELFGVKTVPVPELGHVQDRVFDEEMRRLSDEKRRLDKGSLY